jgi:hypothetical protein
MILNDPFQEYGPPYLVGGSLSIANSENEVTQNKRKIMFQGMVIL